MTAAQHPSIMLQFQSSCSQETTPDSQNALHDSSWTQLQHRDSEHTAQAVQERTHIISEMKSDHCILWDPEMGLTAEKQEKAPKTWLGCRRHLAAAEGTAGSTLGRGTARAGGVTAGTPRGHRGLRNTPRGHGHTAGSLWAQGHTLGSLWAHGQAAGSL